MSMASYAWRAADLWRTVRASFQVHIAQSGAASVDSGGRKDYSKSNEFVDLDKLKIIRVHDCTGRQGADP